MTNSAPIVNQPFQPREPERFAAATNRFDEENARDPHSELLPAGPRPGELVYAQWLTDWVLRLAPGASEELRLAARCQHICRWMVPRDSYPLSRAGYFRWREELKKFHAKKASGILREVGYSEEAVARVQNLNLKSLFPEDQESRVLEDALCLVFLEHQLAELAKKTSDDKLINALQKAWEKMTPTARKIALGLEYGVRESALIEKAQLRLSPASPLPPAR